MNMHIGHLGLRVTIVWITTSLDILLDTDKTHWNTSFILDYAQNILLWKVLEEAYIEQWTSFGWVHDKNIRIDNDFEIYLVLP